MSELEPLSEAARAAITDELRAPSADPAMRARVAGKLEAALGAAFAATAVTSAANAASSASASASTGAFSLTHGKLAAIVAATAVAGAAAGVGVDRAVHPRTVTTVVAPPPSVAAPPPVASAPAVVPSPSVSAEAPPIVKPAPSAKPRPSAEPEGDLARERALIDAARAGLKHGNPSAALDAVQRHAKSFPSGQLREEREGIRILALAALGRRDEAKALDTKFKAAYPDSLFRPQIDAALGSLE